MNLATAARPTNDLQTIRAGWGWLGLACETWVRMARRHSACVPRTHGALMIASQACEDTK